MELLELDMDLLESVVVDPSVLGGPVKRDVLQKCADRVRNNLPRCGDDAHPLARDEQQGDEQDPVQ